MVDWISKSEYAAKTNKTTAEVQRLINEGLLHATLTDGGGKWMIKVERNDEIENLVNIVVNLVERVDKLSKHFGIYS